MTHLPVPRGKRESGEHCSSICSGALQFRQGSSQTARGVRTDCLSTACVQQRGRYAMVHVNAGCPHTVSDLEEVDPKELGNRMICDRYEGPW